MSGSLVVYCSLGGSLVVNISLAWSNIVLQVALLANGTTVTIVTI
jgi:hypothetical protein